MTSIVTTNELPTVDFGKYKNKSVIDLMQDKNYCDWAIKNGVISNNKRANIYNIIISGKLPNTDNPTPEHNKLQNLFLNTEFRNNIKLIKFPENTEKKLYKLHNSTVEFEAMGNWDVLLEVKFTKYVEKENYLFYQISVNSPYCSNTGIDKFFFAHTWCEYQTTFQKLKDRMLTKYVANFESLKEKVIQDYDNWIKKERCGDNDIIKKNDKEFIKTGEFKSKYCFIEIKTSVGDDYPCILRKMSTQIELTKKTPEYRRVHGTVAFILLIDKFESKSTSVKELRTIFYMKGIRVTFFNELNLNEKQLLNEKIKYHKEQLENYNEQLNNLESKNDIFIEDN
jgi:hypothetical protein